MNQQDPYALSPQEVEVGRRTYAAKLKAAATEFRPVALTLQEVREIAAILEVLGTDKDTRSLGMDGPDESDVRRSPADVGYNIVNQLADEWEVPVKVRQATNDKCRDFAAKLVAEPVHAAYVNAQRAVSEVRFRVAGEDFRAGQQCMQEDAVRAIRAVAEENR